MSRSSIAGAVRLWALIGLGGLAPLGAARADTTVPIMGIGTSLPGDPRIETRVDSVTYSDPMDVTIHGIPAVEIRGTVSGIGWGGIGVVPGPASSHYQYNIPFVARWRKNGPSRRLVFFHHGGGLRLLDAVKRNKQFGDANAHRFNELNGDRLAGIGALLDRAAYISINRMGLRGDGTFSATYLSPVPPLTAEQVATVESELAFVPGDPNFRQPGIEVGAPMPALPTNDAPTSRDIARALAQVVEGILDRPFETRIGVGISSGARLLAAMNFGRSVIGTKSVRTGGNHVVPYDASSAKIFDGFILNGFSYAAGVQHVDTTLPLSGPAMLIQGQGDAFYQHPVTLAHELLQKGVVLDGSIWIYEIRNLTHVTRDIPGSIVNGEGDCLGCVLSAAISNLHAHLEHENSPPPKSRLDGRIVDGSLRFDQAGSTTTNMAPVRDDPEVDSIVVDRFLTPQFIGSAETQRWQAVTAALPHTNEALRLPAVECRVGGHKLSFFGSQLEAFTPQVLAARYGSFERYRARVQQTVARLNADRLYDPKVESAADTAQRARSLFNARETPPAFCLSPMKRSHARERNSRLDLWHAASTGLLARPGPAARVSRSAPMPRSSWKGYLKLSLVSVPVKGYTAHKSAGEVRLNQLHEACHSRIKYKKTCPIHGEVPNDEIVSGYEYSDGQYVVIEPEEIDKLRTEVEKRAVNIDAVVPMDSLDPVYFTDKTYYLVPDGAIGQKPYALIQQCLADDELQAIGRVTLFGREELVAVRPAENLLAMTALKYEAEVTHAESLDEEIEAPNLDREELNLTKTLLKSFQKKKFSIAGYKDPYIEKLRQLVEAKVEGKELVTPPETEEPQVINLMDALKRSVAAAQGEGEEAETAPKRAKKKLAPSRRRAKPAKAKRKSG